MVILEFASSSSGAGVADQMSVRNVRLPNPV